TVDLTEIEGDYQHGSAVLGSRMKRGTMRLRVKVSGTSLAQMTARAAALVSAVRARSFTVTYTANGTVLGQWMCHASSIALARGLDAVDVEKLESVYVLTIPRQPVPIQGAI